MTKVDNLVTSNPLTLDYDDVEERRDRHYRQFGNQSGEHWRENSSRNKNAYYKKKPSSHKPHQNERGRCPPEMNRSRPRSKGLGQKIFEQLGKISNLAGCHRLEGPKSLRALSFCGGVACTTTSLLAISQLQKIIMNPPNFILLVYQVFFGVAAMIIEAKNSRMFESTQPWINTWFPFLMEPVGKGFFFILVGVLGMSLWQTFLFVACSGGFMSCIGFLYLIVSCGGQQKLSRVGIELTQHPARGGYQKLPNIGQHRTKSGSRFESPQFGHYDTAQVPLKESEADFQDDEYMEDSENMYPVEYAQGLGQHMRQMAHVRYDSNM